ncbi:hypothetical protein B0H17DRAFT_1146954 [Mycena rosella]|uniref:PH domain-containing protein n=1 Tax=Mycena rosella TaxID=1033263 RepID=A0AAD7CMW4_MYCRO|nr:hypothetical protein B0H17DRAFT_1146954 [Mycena rosella]
MAWERRRCFVRLHETEDEEQWMEALLCTAARLCSVRETKVVWAEKERGWPDAGGAERNGERRNSRQAFPFSGVHTAPASTAAARVSAMGERRCRRGGAAGRCGRSCAGWRKSGLMASIANRLDPLPSPSVSPKSQHNPILMLRARTRIRIRHSWGPCGAPYLILT